jgi:hypothetical protein
MMRSVLLIGYFCGKQASRAALIHNRYSATEADNKDERQATVMQQGLSFGV